MCFEQYYAHLQEVKIVLLQHLVSLLSVSGSAPVESGLGSYLSSLAPVTYRYGRVILKWIGLWCNVTGRGAGWAPGSLGVGQST
jgi:hypothetical protein